MTSAASTTAAMPRERIAFGVILNDSARITSPKPGISTRMIARIASGVTSRSAMPVPPVVRINRQPCAMNERIASRMRSTSSGTIASASTLQPRRWHSARTAGPPASSYSPADARSDTVMTPTVIMISFSRGA